MTTNLLRALPAPMRARTALRGLTALAVIVSALCLLEAPAGAAGTGTATVLEFDAGKPVVRRVSAAEAAKLRRRGITVFPNRKIRLFDDVRHPADQTPADSGPGSDTSDEDVEIRPCFMCYLPALYTTGRSTVVAVIDSGVDPHHEKLRDQLMPGANFVPESDLGEYPWSDGEGHGTHVAGIVAQVDPTARIMPVRVVDREGAGEAASIAEGIVWAVDNGAKVLNLSLGAAASDAPMGGPLHAAVQYAASRDVVVVAAAGNEGEEGSPANYPAAWPEVIAVAAGEPSSSFSNRGSYVDIATSGAGVRSAALGGGVTTMTGTSMAAPRVAGAAAVLRTLHPEWSAADVRDHLLATAEDAGRPGPDAVFGHGRLDIRRAASEPLTRPSAAVPAPRHTKARVAPVVAGVRITAPRGAKRTFVESDDGMIAFSTRSEIFNITRKTRVTIWSYDRFGEPTAPLVRTLRPVPAPPIKASAARAAGVVNLRFKNAGILDAQYAVYLDRAKVVSSYIDGSATSFSFRNTTASSVKVCWTVGFVELGCTTTRVR